MRRRRTCRPRWRGWRRRINPAAGAGRHRPRRGRRAALTRVLKGKAGLVWLVTNNRNSPNNDQATAQRNREFYALIHRGAAIDKALAFPLRMPVQGAALQRERPDGVRVRGRAGRRTRARRDAGRRPRAARDHRAAGAPETAGPRHRAPGAAPRRERTRRRAGDGCGGPPACATSNRTRWRPARRIQWQLQNTMYPYTIADATISPRARCWRRKPSDRCAHEHRHAAGAGQAPSRWRPACSCRWRSCRANGRWPRLKSAGSAYVLPGRIELHLAGPAAGAVAGVPRAHGGAVPRRSAAGHLHAAGRDPGLDRGAAARGEGALRLGTAVALLGGAPGAAGGRRRRRVCVRTAAPGAAVVEDELRTVHARAGATQPIYDKAGKQVASLKTTLFGHQLIDLREGAQVRLGR
jgi:hypothetical protein